MAKKKSASKDRESSTAPVEAAAEAATNFEESLSEVERTVRELESGQLTLADSLRAYERGVRELRQCHEHLEKVERRIEVLVGFDEEGRPVTEPFEDESLTLEQKQSARGRRRGAGARKAAAADDELGERTTHQRTAWTIRRGFFRISSIARPHAARFSDRFTARHW